MSEPGPVALVIALARHRTLCGMVLLVCILGGIAMAVLTRPIYRAEVVLSPVQTEDLPQSLSAITGRLGDFGSLLGLGLGGQQSVEEAVALLQSKQLIGEFIEENGLLPKLFKDDWDASRGTWYETDVAKIPTVGDAIKLFQDEVLSVSRDKNTGLVSVSIYWEDPELAASWANAIVAKADREMRTRAIEEAEKSRKYLETELEKTNAVEVKQAIYRLEERQIQTIMLANIREEFSFRVIDPARVPEADQYVKPRRLIIVAASLAFGLLSACILALGIENWRNAFGAPYRKITASNSRS